MMTKIQREVEACNVLNRASRELTGLLGNAVELRLIAPDVQSIAYVSQGMRVIADNAILAKVIEVVCEREGISFEDLISMGRRRKFADARKLTVMLCRRYVPEITLMKLGDVFNRDHSTLVYNLQNGADLLATDRAFKAKWDVMLAVLDKELEGEV